MRCHKEKEHNEKEKKYTKICMLSAYLVFGVCRLLRLVEYLEFFFSHIRPDGTLA